MPFTFRQQLEFTRKELRETLRDRRTIVTLLVMPILLYPLLGFGLRYIAFQQADQAQLEYRLAVETDREAMWLSESLAVGDRALSEAKIKRDESQPDLQLLVPNDPSQFDLRTMVSQSAADLGIQIRIEPQESSGLSSATVTLVQNSGSTLSRDVADYVKARLSAANLAHIKQWVNQQGQELDIPIQQKEELVQPAEAGSAILGLLPLVLLLMTVTGGVYPAIDLTAGERERNTMETLMALPVPRFRMLAAKYVAVVTVTMLTGLMNLLAMSLTLYALQLDEELLGGDGLTFLLATKLFVALVAFALFYSAVLLLLTSTARSFKEAQAYLIPLLLLSIAPGLVILMPGWNLSGFTATVPLINILLLTQTLLEGTVELLPAAVAVISTVLYGVAVLSLAAQVFGNDAVAVGSRGRWSELWQRSSTALTRPTLPAVMMTLALLFPFYFIVSGILARGESEPASRLRTSAIMTAVLFVGVPLLVLRLQRISVGPGLRLTRPRWRYLFAAVLFGVATWPWVFEIIVLAEGLGLRRFDPSDFENVDSLLASWKQVPLWLVVVCLGIVAGVCEEVFFRGFLFAGLKQHLGAIATIAISAVCFGLFHVVLSGGAAPERILPSALMGVLLGWLAWRSESTIPSMVLHAVHNSTLLVVVNARDQLAEWNIGQTQQQHLPLWWLAISATVFSLGIVLVLAKQSVTRTSESSMLDT
ncbi:MAG: ABC transporter permease subunit/CPBP intramembrane protease [Planctomycetota bacterium]